MAKPPKAQNPITWLTFQAVMSDFGYEMVKHTESGDGVVFRLTPDAVTEGFKNPVTVTMPDWVASDGITPAYERDYVVDLLTQLTGNNGGKSIVTILAKRQIDS